MPSLSGLPSLGRAVRAVRITTNLNPEVALAFDDGQAKPAGQGGGMGELLGKLLRPRVVVDTAAGPIVLEPYGEPQPIIGLGLLLLLGYVVVRAVRG